MGSQGQQAGLHIFKGSLFITSKSPLTSLYTNPRCVLTHTHTHTNQTRFCTPGGNPVFKGSLFMTSKGPLTSTIPNAHVG